MATDAKEICQLALGNLGETRELTSLGEQSKEAKACSRWYPTARDIVLRAYPWPFARRIASLVLAPTESNIRWQYMYDLPSDFLKERYLHNPLGRNAYPPIPFAIERSAADMKNLLGCDQPVATLVYTRALATDNLVPLIPAPVVDALSWKLAARLVPALALKPDQAIAAEKMYTLLANEAYADAMTEPMEPLPDSEFITVRG
jgi:hypothetical protein